jgi:hypothetical protein
MTQRALVSTAFIAALAAAGCTASESVLEPGATSFVTQEPEFNNNNNNNYGGASDMGLAASADGGTGGSPGAPMGRTGTVEEGDIYRIDHNRLFYFNTYRGLIIYDLSDAQHPQKISRVPVYGYPVEMYVENDRVYALVRDALYLTQDANGQKFDEHHTSQLISIDISDLGNPKVVTTIDIIGQLREGLSRKIDDTIYVVSYFPQNYYDLWWSDWGWYGPIDTDKEQAWVYSFNIADPAHPQLVDKLQMFEGGSASTPAGGSGSVDRWFQGVTISATANTLHVVENWQTYGYVPYGPQGCGASFSNQQAVVSIVDISDPTGQIKLYTKFDTYGALRDQFKQTYVYDDASKKAYYFGIFERQEWESSACSGNSFVQNSFQTWDVTDAAHPQRVGFLPFGDKNEAVSASIFDTSRHVAYAITARAVDPMFAIGFSDPTTPTVLSQIDGLSGNINVFSFVGSNQFLMGIGTDNSDACTGFATGSTSWHTGVSVSILDVKDLNATRLVQRGCIDVKDAQWVGSPANWNLDQGHKMIGLGSDGTTSVVTVPVDYWKRTDDPYWYWYEGGSSVGMMSFDLSVYDPTKPETQQTVLTNHGSFDHAHGSVRRTIVFNHEESVGTRRMVLNLSDTYLSLFDIQDLDHPTKQSELELAPDVQELYKFGDYMVEHVRDEPDRYTAYDLRSEFRIKPIGGRLDDTAPVASFAVGQVERVLRWKDSLVIFRHPPSGPGPYLPSSQLVVYDLSNPTAPTLRSRTDLGFVASYGYYGWWCGWRGYFGGWWWSSPSSWMSIDDGVVFEVDDYGGYPDYSLSRRLVYVDLGNLDAPQVHSHDLPTNATKVTGITPDESDPSGFFVTLKDHVGDLPGQGDYKIALYKYYAQRWQVRDGDVVAGDATNLPGQLVRSWKSGDRTMLLAQDYVYQWSQLANAAYGYYASDPRLHLLERTGAAQGTLRDSLVAQGRYLQDLTADGDRLYLRTGYNTNVGYWDVDPAKRPDTSDHLSIFELGEQKLDRKFDGSIGLARFDIMGSGGDRLFLRLYGDGVLVLNAADPQAPRGEAFLRTLGWGTHLELSGTTMFVAAGQFGVFQRELATSTLKP